MRWLPFALVSLVACFDSDGKDTGRGDAAPDATAAAFLQAHNDVRAGVAVAPLGWDADVAATALRWAAALAANQCAFEHDTQQTYGENLWWSSWDPTPEEVVLGWASEVADYDYDANTCADGAVCGHYTQVVWADSQRLGCGAATCDDGSVIWNCRYDPPGNWVGERPY